MEQSLFHPVVLLCVTQRKVSNIQPHVLREIGVDTNNYEASPACFAFSGVKCERESWKGRLGQN